MPVFKAIHIQRPVDTSSNQSPSEPTAQDNAPVVASTSFAWSNATKDALTHMRQRSGGQQSQCSQTSKESAKDSGLKAWSVRGESPPKTQRLAQQPEIRASLLALAHEGFDVEAQTHFIQKISTLNLSSEQLSELTQHVRCTLPPDGSARVGTLRRYFNAQGVRLFDADRLAPEFSESTLNRQAFKSQLGEMEARGLLFERSSMRRLVVALSKVTDPRELRWAQWQIKRRQLDPKNAPRDAKTGRSDVLDRFFEKNLGAGYHPKQLALLIDKARSAGFKGGSVEVLQRALEHSKNDPKTIFHARRHLKRSLQDAQNALTRPARKAARKAAFLEKKLHGETSEVMAADLRKTIAQLQVESEKAHRVAQAPIKKLVDIEERFERMTRPWVQGCLDKVAIRKEVIAQFKQGQISGAQASLRMSALSLSDSGAEWTALSAYFQDDITWFVWLSEALSEAQSELWEDFSRTFSDDTYDSEGHLIETAVQRERGYENREESLEEIQSDRAHDAYDEELGALLGRQGQSFARHSRTKSPGLRGQLEAEEASIDNEIDSLGAPRD
jgi:hypothetical protein